MPPVRIIAVKWTIGSSWSSNTYRIIPLGSVIRSALGGVNGAFGNVMVRGSEGLGADGADAAHVDDAVNAARTVTRTSRFTAMAEPRGGPAWPPCGWV